MGALSIKTSQNTQLNVSESSIGERIIATVIDLAVMAVYASVGAIIFRDNNNYLTFLYFLPLMFYSIVFELIWGKSLGKKILNLEIIHDSGAPLSFVHILLRWVLRIVDIWLFFGSVGTISIILSKRGQRLGDLAAGTLVVKSKKGFKNFEESYFVVENSYVPVFGEVKLLNDEDIRIIKEALGFVKEKGYAPPAGKILTRVRNFIENKMEVKSSLKNVPFLETVLKDYYALH